MQNVTLLQDYVHICGAHMLVFWVSKFAKAPYQLQASFEMIICYICPQEQMGYLLFPPPQRCSIRIFFLEECIYFKMECE